MSIESGIFTTATDVKTTVSRTENAVTTDVHDDIADVRADIEALWNSLDTGAISFWDRYEIAIVALAMLAAGVGIAHVF